MFTNTSLAAQAHHRRIPRATAAGRWATCALGAAMALTLSACGSGSDPIALASKPLAEGCPAYNSADLPHGAKITRTEVREAQGGLPEVCIVRGQIVSSPESTILWAVELPALAQWNGKTLTIGGGGLDGFIPTDDPWYSSWWGRPPTRM